MELRAEEMLRGLAGPNPTLIEELLARRVVNSWVAVSALEVDLALREPADRRSRETLDRMIGRAQRRLTEAARELARVRRLALPDVFARVRPLHAGRLPHLHDRRLGERNVAAVRPADQRTTPIFTGSMRRTSGTYFASR